MRIIDELLTYKQGACDRRWEKAQKFSYVNEYIELVRVDSSNNWLSSTEMTKQWSIIVHKKKEFTTLPNCILLEEHGFLKITPVQNGENAGCFGIRLYGMKKNPNEGIVKRLLNYIFEGVCLSQAEKNTISTISEEAIESYFEAEDDSSGFKFSEGIKKVRKLNKQIIDSLKKIYKGECQLCGRKAGEPFDVELVQAHHIEYYSKTQNNNSTNIIILCPNCHALIHKCNPKYEKDALRFRFDNGTTLTIKTAGHLKGHTQK